MGQELKDLKAEAHFLIDELIWRGMKKSVIYERLGGRHFADMKTKEEVLTGISKLKYEKTKLARKNARELNDVISRVKNPKVKKQKEFVPSVSKPKRVFKDQTLTHAEMKEAMRQLKLKKTPWYKRLLRIWG